MIRLSTSYSKKIPADQQYSSQSFHAGVEMELPDAVAGDAEAIRKQLRGMYQLLKASVDEQIAAAGNGGGEAVARPKSAGNGTNGQRSATQAQVRAIHAIAKRLDLDVAELVKAGFGVAEPEELTIRQASQLIEDLKARAEA